MAVVNESLKICTYLENLLEDTFGPCGLDIMLNSSSGKILITNSCGVIVNSLCFGHPLANVIVDKLKSHNEITGDGCCAFILVLAQALRGIADVLQSKSQADLTTSSLQTMLSLSKHFMKMQSELEFLVRPKLEKISTSVDLNSTSQTSVNEVLSHTIHSCLNGKFSKSVQKLLSKLLLDLITKTCSRDNFYDDIIKLIDDLPQWCIQFHGMPFLNSHIEEGFAIPRELPTGQDVALPKPGETSFTFILLQCSLDCSRDFEKAELEVESLSLHSKALLHNQTTCFSILKSFKEQDIQLLISSESVSDMVLHLCRQLGIAVIQMVPMETTDYICRLANVQPICSVNQNDIQSISDNYKGKGCSCLEKIVAGQKHVQLTCVSPQSTQRIYHIVLNAPTQGLLQQYCIGIQAALKCIKMSFSESHKELTLLPGCGSVEFVISQIFDELCQATTTEQMATAFGVLSKAFLQIPRVLHRNSHQSGDSNYMRVQAKMLASWKRGILLGVDEKTGDVVDPHSIHIYDPYQGKILLISHVLQCLAKLLRIDKIIGVSCLSVKSD